MMGLRTMTVAATEAGGALRRIILLATVAALMAVMSVVSAPAAFAHGDHCPGNGEAFYAPGDPADKDGDGVICGYPAKGGKYNHFKDDHGYDGH